VTVPSQCPKALRVPKQGSNNYYYVTVGDFNGDGRPDFAAMSVAGFIDTFVSQQSLGATLTGASVAGAGDHNVVASYGGDTNFTAAHRERRV